MAGPPSPLNPATPVPATVVIIPVVASTLRILLFPWSAMKRLPAPSSASPNGRAKSAASAGPPSPPKPPSPVPTNVLKTPVDEIRKTLFRVVEDTKVLLPLESTAMPVTVYSACALAFCPSVAIARPASTFTINLSLSLSCGKPLTSKNWDVTTSPPPVWRTSWRIPTGVILAMLRVAVSRFAVAPNPVVARLLSSAPWNWNLIPVTAPRLVP